MVFSVPLLNYIHLEASQKSISFFTVLSKTPLSLHLPITAIKATPICAPTPLSTGRIHRLVSFQSFSLILQQDFPGEVLFTVKWFNLQTGAIPLPCNFQAHHPYISHVFAFVFSPISQWADVENTSPYKRVIFLLA